MPTLSLACRYPRKGCLLAVVILLRRHWQLQLQQLSLLLSSSLVLAAVAAEVMVAGDNLHRAPCLGVKNTVVIGEMVVPTG